LLAAIWLAYVFYPARDAWREPAPQRYIGLAAVVLFAASYVTAFAAVPRLLRQDDRGTLAIRAGLTALSALLGITIVVLLGEPNLPVFIYVAVVAMFLLPGRWSWTVVGAVVVGTALSQRLVAGWHVDYTIVFQILVAGVATWGIMQVIARNRALALAHQEIARLAAEEERNRLSRDLHDILGHSLTVVAVKAELAGRLVRLDPQRAEAEILDVERLARGALSDVRAAVAGRRDVTLATELGNARTALAAAGIDASLRSAIDDVPADHRELFGWVVREGVTNVIRHSGASRCEVRLSPSTVAIVDDGSAASQGVGGHGLAGLRERTEAMGGTLRAGRTPGGGFALTVTVPA
jgi:two-component system sensor histidine kinase DesK